MQMTLAKVRRHLAVKSPILDIIRKNACTLRGRRWTNNTDAQRVDLELTPPSLHAGVTAKHRLSLSTRANAAAYLEEVRMKARAAEAK